MMRGFGGIKYNDMEQTQSYKVRYAWGQGSRFTHIKTISAHSRWEAIDRVYNENIGQFPWIERSKLTAVLNR
jgi:hypothetical protein